MGSGVKRWARMAVVLLAAAVGLTMATTSVAWAAARPAKISLTTSAKLPGANLTVLLTTTLKTRAGKPVKGKTVTVQRLSGARWVKVRSGRTSSKGKFAFRTLPYRKARTVYRAVYSSSLKSTSVAVKPHAFLYAPDGPSRWQVGTPFDLVGLLSPTHAAGSSCVTIYLSWGDSAEGPWTAHTTFQALGTPPTADSNYAASVVIPDSSHTYWRFRAFHEDADHAASWSPELVYEITSG